MEKLNLVLVYFICILGFVSSNTKTSRSTINNNCTFNSKQRTIDSEDDISELDE